MEAAQIKLRDHPRARRQISRAKAWGALAAFALVGLLSWRAGVPAFEVGLRALAAGVVGWVLAWAMAVQVWRYLAVAEVRAVQREMIERRERIAAEMEGGETAIIRGGAS